MILSFSGDLAYRDVAGGKLKMLMPADFINVPKEAYKKHYADEPVPDYFYCNKDTSEYVALMKMPNRMADLSQAKQMGQMALLDSTTKVHFNDTITVNGNKIYLLDMDSKLGRKPESIKTFIINIPDGTVMGMISCNLALKKTWLPVSDQMFRSIKLI